MSQMRVKVTGIAWFRPEEYDQLRAMFVDGESLPETYQEWLKKAQGLFERLVAQGHRVEKVLIGVVEFPVWCEGKGKLMCSKSRIDYANEFVAMKYLKN